MLSFLIGWKHKCCFATYFHVVEYSCDTFCGARESFLKLPPFDRNHFLYFQRFRWVDKSPVAFQKLTKSDLSHQNKYLFKTYADIFTYSLENLYKVFDGDNYHTYKYHFTKAHNTSDKSPVLCLAMVLVNLLEPEWFKLPCTQPILIQVICTKKNTNTRNKSFVSSTEASEACVSCHIQKLKNCYFAVFRSMSRWRAGERLVSAHKTKPAFYLVHNFHEIQFLTNIVKISPISSHPSTDSTVTAVYFYDKTKETYQQVLIPLYQSPVTHQFYKLPRKTFPTNSNIFKCNASHFISILYFLDNQQHCPDNSDEEFHCGTDFEQPKINSTSCVTNNTANVHRPLHFKTMNGSFAKYSFPHSANNVPDKKSSALECCQNQEAFACNSPTEMFYLHDICIYRLNTNGFLSPCSDGKHVEKCINFTCNMMFKCTRYYCIAWEYICNGVWDCPLGTDEVLTCMSSNHCSNMFKCAKSSLCIHIGQVCDGFENCPHQDDEYFCELKNIKCPHLCKCLAFAIVCAQTRGLLTFPEKHYPYVFVHISSATVPKMTIFKVFSTLMNVEIRKTDLSDVCGIFSSRKLFRVSVTLNNMTLIQSFCFANHKHLHSIFLDRNGLKYIKENAFTNVSSLQILSLANNSLVGFKRHVFGSVCQLKFLSLSGNSITEADLNLFSSVFAKTIQTTSFQICCLTPENVKCVSKKRKPWYVSCAGLLSRQNIKVLFLVLPVLLLLANVLCMIICLCQAGKHKGFNTLVLSTNATEVIWSLLFCIIYVNDKMFSESFVLCEKHWKNSVLCYTITGSYLAISFSDPSVVLLLSYVRFRLVANPLCNKYKEVHHCKNWVASTTIVWLLVAVAFTFALKYQTNPFPSKFCLPVEDPTKSILLVHFVAWILGCYQIAATVSVCLCHLFLVKTVWDTQNVIREGSTVKPISAAMYIQLITITCSNILSWVPSNVVYLCCLYLTRYPSWLIPLALVTGSLNGLVNPTVFISTSLRSILRSSIEKQHVLQEESSRKLHIQ